MQTQSVPGLFWGVCFVLVCLLFIGSISKDPIPWVIILHPVNSYCRFPLFLPGYLGIRED